MKLNQKEFRLKKTKKKNCPKLEKEINLLQFIHRRIKIIKKLERLKRKYILSWENLIRINLWTDYLVIFQIFQIMNHSLIEILSKTNKTIFNFEPRHFNRAIPINFQVYTKREASNYSRNYLLKILNYKKR